MLKKVSLLLLITIILFGFGCDKNTSSEKPYIVTTTGMIADIVKKIAGDTVKTQNLIPAGVDPHIYIASEGDVAILSKADLIFYNGLNLEARLGELFEKMNDKKTITAVAESIPKSQLITSAKFENIYDPHIWLDVKLWTKVANHIFIELSRLVPEKKEIYHENFKKLEKKLIRLDNNIKNELKILPQSSRMLVTAHDAFGYFGIAYGLDVVGLQGMSTNSKPGTKDVQRLVDYIIEKKIKAIFFESTISPRTIKAVQESAHAKGWNVKVGGKLYADALGPKGSDADTYMKMIEHNVKTIIRELR